MSQRNYCYLVLEDFDYFEGYVLEAFATEIRAYDYFKVSKQSFAVLKVEILHCDKEYQYLFDV